MGILESMAKFAGEHPGMIAAGAAGAAIIHNDTFKDLPRDMTNEIVGAPVDEIIMGQKMDLGSILFDTLSPIKLPRIVNMMPDIENKLQYVSKATIADSLMTRKDYAKQYAREDVASGYNDAGFIQSRLPSRPVGRRPNVDGSLVFGMYGKRFN